MPTPHRARHDPGRPGSGPAIAEVGAALLVLICCAAPVLFAAGLLGAVGAWLSNPWVIAAAVAPAATVQLSMLARRGRANRTDPGDPDACCPPTPTPPSVPHRSDLPLGTRERPAPAMTPTPTAAPDRAGGSLPRSP
jgi:mercuric ion transport protein